MGSALGVSVPTVGVSLRRPAFEALKPLAPTAFLALTQ